MPYIPADTKQRPTDNPAVVGAGTMGGGIAMSFADNGYDVKITDATKEALDRGMARIKRQLRDQRQARQPGAGRDGRARFARIHPVPSIDDLGDCDVVIEAVFEQIAVKQEVWKKLDAVMKPGALLYSNTSGIDIDIMANATKRPQDVAGTHFFAPANVMKLFEVVKGSKSAPTTCWRPRWRWAARSARCRGSPAMATAFVANRSRAPFGMEMNILRRGGRAARADRQGHGRFRLSDRPVRRRRPLRPRYRLRHPQAPRRRCTRTTASSRSPTASSRPGGLGQKTNAGWYRYEPGDRTPHPDPEVARIIKETAAELGIQQRSDFTDDEILQAAAVRLGQRGLQDPRGRRCAAAPATST